MRDTSIPSFLVPQDGQAIVLTISSTDALLEDQGYTYNQAGFSYNQTGVEYGGVYNSNEDELPILNAVKTIYPSLNILSDGNYINVVLSNTQALLYDQGYSYNQSGFTYDQVAVAYAGVYNQNEDVVPSTLSFTDVYSPFVPPPKNQVLGPGWFMFITQ